MLEFAGRFSNPKLLLKNFKYWAVVFKENPVVLGQVVIVLKRETPDFSSITAEEMSEFPSVCKWFEAKTKSLYGAKKFNYCAIMMKEQFVHFNVYPRYSEKIIKYNKEWADEGWPKKVIENKIEISEDLACQIIADLKEN